MSGWFSVVLEFEAQVHDAPTGDDGLCEASVRLINASDIEDAHKRAMDLGRESEHHYFNELGERVTWQFRGVVEVQEVGSETIVDGIEVFSRLYRKGCPGASGARPERS